MSGRGDHPTPDERPTPTERIRRALASWSAIAEPGDAAAHALVGVLGPDEALAWASEAAADPVGASMDLAGVAASDLVDAVVAGLGRWHLRASAWDPDPHLERASRVGARCLVRGDQEWPRGFDDLGSAAPFCLWVRGPLDAGAAWSRAIAIVGSRSCTAYGEHMTAEIAAGVADDGWTVVSGGAFGIDARAHRATLAVGGETIAVMAGGVDRLYPEGNADLLRRVVEAGAVVSESPPGYAPHRHRFLTRNRLIAAARATVVVEAAHRSGALSTASHAAHLGRPLGAVPGPATSAASAGCHRLVREGATLVASARDALSLVEPLDATRPDDDLPMARGGATPAFGSDEQRRAYDAIARRGSTVRDVAKDSGLGLDAARAALGGLSLTGLARRDGALWRRIPARR